MQIAFEHNLITTSSGFIILASFSVECGNKAYAAPLTGLAYPLRDKRIVRSLLSASETTIARTASIEDWAMGFGASRDAKVALLSYYGHFHGGIEIA